MSDRRIRTENNSHSPLCCCAWPLRSPRLLPRTAFGLQCHGKPGPQGGPARPRDSLSGQAPLGRFYGPHRTAHRSRGCRGWWGAWGNISTASDILVAEDRCRRCTPRVVFTSVHTEGAINRTGINMWQERHDLADYSHGACTASDAPPPPPWHGAGWGGPPGLILGGGGGGGDK